MRKKVNLLILLFVAVLVVSLALVACGKIQDVTKAPDDIGVLDPDAPPEEKASQTEEQLMLRFVFRKYMSSIFSSIPYEEFTENNCEKLGEFISYQIIYASSGASFDDKLYPLTMDMVNDDCKGLLSQPGHHVIKVSLPRKGKDPVEGAFTLHLAEPQSNIQFVTLSFNLAEGTTAYFGKLDTSTPSAPKAVVEVQKGTSCTWDDFERNFLMLRPGFVLDGIAPGNFSPASTESIVFDEDKTYTPVWRENRIEVDFDLNLPDDAILKEGRTQQAVNDEIRTQSVLMDKGVISRPDSEIINSYEGYYFSGWYYKDPDEGNKEKLWLFTQTVDRRNISLYGKWEPRYYRFKIYTMGGRFKDDAADSPFALTEEQVEAGGYTYAQCDIKFDLVTDDVHEITFDKLTYHKEHRSYVVKVQVAKDDPTKVVIVKFSDILRLLEKGGDIFKTNGIYRDVAHTPEKRFNPDGSTVVEKDETCYLEWVMNDDVKEDLDKFSNYYINFAFKGDEGIILKADGTLRINRLFDASMNELIVPATIKWTDGVERPISEIGDKALLDAKALVKVDMSAAKNLTRIGARAFGSCQNLREVTFPTDNNITEVGEDAFTRTMWQNTRFEDGEYGLIVIGTAIYKLVGSDVDELNNIVLETIDFYDDGETKIYKDGPDVVYNISEACFSEATALKTIVLADNVGYIHNLAFNGLAELEAVDANEGTSKLVYIGESAFNGCTKFLTNSVDHHNIVGGDGAIVIGSVLYRLLNKEATSYVVKSNIKSIAPNAFYDCKDITSITFEDASKIETIGKGAFIDTKWAQLQPNGYTIVNGVLAMVYSPELKNRNISVPDTVTSISEYAFGSYARYVETIEFRASVKEIADYAFAGASSIRSFIFTDVSYDSASQDILNIPTISDNSFANAKGVLLSGVKLYFAQEVYDFFSTDACKTKHPDWYEFFRLYGSAFAVENIEGIWINPAVVPNEFVKTTAASPLADSYTDGIVIKSSSGVLKYDTLDKTANTVMFLETEGEHFITFSYKGSQEHCHIAETDEHVFRYNIRNAIKGEPALGSTLDANNKTDADDFWIETLIGDTWTPGFVGDIVSATVPSFYTSHSTLNLDDYRFRYKDYADNLKDLPFTQAVGFAPTINKNSTVTFTIDFYGIGTYPVTVSYVGVKSKYIEIEQKEAISIPLNGTATTYLRNSYVYLKGQDGREQKVLFNLNSFKLEKVDGISAEQLVTDKLGMHVMRVKYSSEDTEGELTADIVYSVVLEADNSIFTFEIVNQEKLYARISACSNKTADTLVIPDKYTDKNGVTYLVTEIGNSVFKDFTALRTVYLPASLKKIGSNAFAGCTLLEEVFSSTQTAYTPNKIPDADFEDMRIEVIEIGTVEVSELLFTIIPNTLTVPAKFTWSYTEGIVETEYEATPVFTDDMFDKCKGTIWLFDSEYNRAYAAAHLANKKVEFYTEEDNRIPAADSRFKLDKSKFMATEKHIVKRAKLLTLENVALNADGNIIITPSFEMPVTYQDEYLIKNTETGDTQLAWVEQDADYSAPTGWEIVNIIKAVPTFEQDYVSATADELLLPDGFDGFVYLPDTIYNLTTLVDGFGNEYPERLTVYKSGATTLVGTLDYVPDTLEYIGTTAFKDCIALRNLEFGEATQLTDICAMAFAGCTALEEIKFGKNIADWQNVELGQDWDQNTGSYVIKCKDDNLQKA